MMKNETVTINVSAEKLRAIKRFMRKRGANLDEELSELVDKLYTKYVPASVREYIDEGDEDTPISPNSTHKSGKST